MALPAPAPVPPVATPSQSATGCLVQHVYEPDGFGEDYRAWPELTGCMWAWLATPK